MKLIHYVAGDTVIGITNLAPVSLPVIINFVLLEAVIITGVLGISVTFVVDNVTDLPTPLIPEPTKSTYVLSNNVKVYALFKPAWTCGPFGPTCQV
jgi:hypothetical protein